MTWAVNATATAAVHMTQRKRCSAAALRQARTIAQRALSSDAVQAVSQSAVGAWMTRARPTASTETSAGSPTSSVGRALIGARIPMEEKIGAPTENLTAGE